MPYGTQTTLDSLRALQGTTVIEYGEDNIFGAVQTELAIINEQANEMIDYLMERTTDRFRRYGYTQSLKMVKIDQTGTADVQKPGLPSSTLGIPLARFQVGLQWTKTAFERMQPREIANTTDNATKADAANLLREIKVALFTSTNRTTFDDLGGDNVQVDVKALLNNDGMVPPLGPNGEVFLGTHTHYLATAALTAANVSALLKTVTEHFSSGQMELYININDEAAVKALAGFTAFPDPRIQLANASTTNVALGGSATYFDLANRAIGIFESAVVWVKPWAIQSYIVANNRAVKVLAYRTYNPTSGNFRLVFEDETQPLRAQFYEREFGIGVVVRHGAAILYTGGGTYTNPTIP